MPKRRYGDVRDTALAAFRAWLNWDPRTEPEPTVNEITISHACGLVWNCRDIVPGGVVDQLCTEGLKCANTYAGCARAILKQIKARRAPRGGFLAA